MGEGEKYGERAQCERGSRRNHWAVGGTRVRQLKRAPPARACGNRGERIRSIESTAIAGERARAALQGTTGMPRSRRPPRTCPRRVLPPGRWVQRIRGVRT